MTRRRLPQRRPRLPRRERLRLFRRPARRLDARRRREPRHRADRANPVALPRRRRGRRVRHPRSRGRRPGDGGAGAARGRRVRRRGVRGVPGRAARSRPQAVAVVRPGRRRAAAHRDVQGDQAQLSAEGTDCDDPVVVRSPSGNVGDGGLPRTAAAHRGCATSSSARGWWTVPPAPVRVLPDGCMDLIRMDGASSSPDPTPPHRSARASARAVRGLALPARRATPAARRARGRTAQRPGAAGTSCGGSRRAARFAGRAGRRAGLRPDRGPRPRHGRCRAGPRHRSLAAGAAVARGGRREIGWSSRTLQRQCAAVYGYGPATLRRILRFRRALRLLEAVRRTPKWPPAPGYADQPHLHREVRESRRRRAVVAASGLQRREQVHPVAVRVGDGRVALAPRRVERLQRPGMARRGELLEQRVDLRRGAEAERQGQPARRPSAAPSLDACRRWFPRCRRAACCRRAARPRRAAPSGSGTARPSSR